MKFYAVIDTNVLVSAMLKRDSIPGSILELAFSGIIVPVLNQAIVQEYQVVLSRPKFHFDSVLVNQILTAIQSHALFVDEEHLEVELPDPNDRVFYEVVMEERKDRDAYLVTGNIKHFPIKPFIVTPRQMLDIIVHRAEE